MELWQSYYEISPVFFVITAIATTLFTMSNLLMVFGGGDWADDGHVPSDVAFKFFSTQSVLAFFMGLGWAGITATVKFKLAMMIAIPLALGFGALLMFFSAFLFRQIWKLNHTSSVTLYSSLGGKALVYATIPEGDKGQVQVVVGGQQKILAAVSESGPIASFTEVEVVGVKDKSTLIVRSLPKPGDSQ